MNKVLKKFAQDILGLFWAGMSLLFALSLFSYNAKDPSFNSLGSVATVHNYCGYFGSFFSDLVLQAFGIASFLIPVGAGWKASNYFWRRQQTLKPWRFFLFSALLINLSSLMVLTQSIFSLNLPFNGGGTVGLVVSQSFTQILNPIGVLIFSVTSMLMLLVFYFEKSLSELFCIPGAIFRFIFSHLKDWSKKIFFSFSDTFGQRQTTKTVDETPQLSSRMFPLEQKTSVESKESVITKTVGRFALKSAGNDEEGPEKSLSIKPVPLKKKKLKITYRSERTGDWDLPELNLLEAPPKITDPFDEKEAKLKAQLLIEKLAQFSVRADVVGIKPGPAVTLFEVKPAADVKISKITDLADDLSLALSCESLRMIAPIPGRDVIGIETSNSKRQNVYLKEVLQNETFWSEDMKLPIALGQQADGEPQVVDLRKMPHLLVAGTTGSGKSVFVVSSLVGLLLKHSPETLKLVLVDPKQVDLAIFNELPHLLMPPIRDPKRAVGALRWAIREMEKRYRSMSKFGARGIEVFNQTVENLSSEERVHHQQFLDSLNSDLHPEAYYIDPQPYIVIVVEEFGDLMAVDKLNVEQAVVRLAQMARASGIHLILAMQSPRRDVVTGLIKTNIPGRISFKVASKTDSRIILDEAGAERLLARGDMLFLAPGVSKPLRNHGAYLSEEEIGRVVNHWKAQGEPEYHPIALKLVDEDQLGNDAPGSDGLDDNDIKDDRYDEILAYVSSQKEMSASLLQRRFRLGYPRAARMMEIFEAEGVVGPAQGSKPRKVLISSLPVVPSERL